MTIEEKDDNEGKEDDRRKVSAGSRQVRARNDLYAPGGEMVKSLNAACEQAGLSDVPLQRRIDQAFKAMRPLQPNAARRKQWLDETFEYTERLHRRKYDKPVFSVTDEHACDELRRVGIPAAGIELSGALELLARTVDRYGLCAGSGGNFAFIPGSDNYLSALADYIGAISNSYPGITEMCPGAGVMEDVLVQWLGQEVIGFKKPCGGDLTSGGSIANLSAVIAARESHGIRARDVDTCAVYTSAQAHHSVAKALYTAGMRDCLQRTIAVDDRFRIRVDELLEKIEQDKKHGLQPWLVVANAGTTDTGAVDELEAIADLAEKYHCWLHIDGAYGAAFSLCEEGRRILRGMHRADSVTLDPHKSLFVPWGCGALLTRDPHTLERAYHFSGNYMRDVSERHAVSSCNVSPELSRPFRALHLWLPLVVQGERAVAAALEEKMLLARYAHRRLSELPDFWVGPEPDLSILVFRYKTASSIDEQNACNEILVQKLFRAGEHFVSTTIIDGRVTLRMAILQVHTHRGIVDRFIETLSGMKSLEKTI